MARFEWKDPRDTLEQRFLDAGFDLAILALQYSSNCH